MDEQTNSILTELEQLRGAVSGISDFLNKKTEKSYKYGVYTISLSAAAIANEEVEMNGEKIYYMEGQSRLRIRLDSMNNDRIDLYPGRKIIAPFKKFYIDAPMADEIVKLVIASPSWFDCHGEGVEVNTLIRSKADFRETELGRAYFGGSRRSGTPSEYGAVQLWNDAASQDILVVRRVAIATISNALGWELGITQVELDTDGEDGPKYSGLPAPTGEVKHGSDTTKTDIMPAASINSKGWFMDDSYYEVLRGDNIILKPGYGLTVVCSTVNEAIQAHFEWIELPLGDVSNIGVVTIQEEVT